MVAYAALSSVCEGWGLSGIYVSGITGKGILYRTLACVAAAAQLKEAGKIEYGRMMGSSEAGRGKMWRCVVVRCGAARRGVAWRGVVDGGVRWDGMGVLTLKLRCLPPCSLITSDRARWGGWRSGPGCSEVSSEVEGSGCGRAERG